MTAKKKRPVSAAAAHQLSSIANDHGFELRPNDVVNGGEVTGRLVGLVLKLSGVIDDRDTSLKLADEELSNAVAYHREIAHLERDLLLHHRWLETARDMAVESR